MSFLYYFHAAISNHLSEKPKNMSSCIWSLNTGLTVLFLLYLGDASVDFARGEGNIESSSSEDDDDDDDDDIGGGQGLKGIGHIHLIYCCIGVLLLLPFDTIKVILRAVSYPNHTFSQKVPKEVDPLSLHNHSPIFDSCSSCISRSRRMAVEFFLWLWPRKNVLDVVMELGGPLLSQHSFS